MAFMCQFSWKWKFFRDTIWRSLILNVTKNGLEKHGKYKYKLIYAHKLEKIKKPYTKFDEKVTHGLVIFWDFRKNTDTVLFRIHGQQWNKKLVSVSTVMLAVPTACDSLSATLRCGARVLIHLQKGHLHRYHDVITVPLNGKGTTR